MKLNTILIILASLPVLASASPLAHLNATLANSDAYRQVQTNVAAAKRGIDISKAMRKPQATATAGYRINEPQSQGRSSLPDKFSRQLIISQEIFKPVNARNVEVAERLLDIATYQAINVRQQLMFSTYRAYLGTVQAKDSLALLDRRAKQLAEQLRFATTAFEVGTASRLEILNVQAQLAALRAEEITAAGRLAAAQRALISLSGLAADNILSLRQPLSVPVNNLSDWLTQANNTPAVQTAAAELRRQIAVTHQLRASILPSVELQGLSDFQNDHSLSLRFNIPIYSSGGATATFERSQLQQDALQAAHAQALTDTQLAIKNAYASIVLQHKRAQALTANVEIAVERLELANAGIELRANILADALNAEADLAAAELQLLQANHAQLQAWLDLLVATGNLNLFKAQELEALFQ